MRRKKITTTQQSETGRNEKFRDSTGREITRAQLVREIEQGKRPGYHVREINGVKTPVSNPDNSESNNLD